MTNSPATSMMTNFFEHSSSAAATSYAPFQSFWQAGYEGADHLNRTAIALDMNRVTGHLERAFDDYQQLAQFGIRTVRESIGWRLVEHDGGFDFSSLESRLQAAQQLGLQICWTFCHYGWPTDIDVFAPEFITRFARYCTAAAEFLAPYAGAAPVYSPINEISFTSWGLSSHLFHCKNMYHERAGEIGKQQLVRATIAGCDAIWRVNPAARILHCDPMIHVIPPPARPDWVDSAASWRESQFEASDMLCGRIQPELGGAPRYLDLMGVNYYHSNQWESGTNRRLWWHLADPRRMPLYQMLVELYARYKKPVLLAETSHVGSGRGVWIREMAEQAALAIQHGVDFRGICIYPVIDRPDWEEPHFWHHSGLWDVKQDDKSDDANGADQGTDQTEGGTDRLDRVLQPTYAQGLCQAQRLTENLCSSAQLANLKKGNSMQTIIVFSHLRWDFVYQRPQQLLTRLAQHYRVIFIEEPIYQAGDSFLKKFVPAPNVAVYQPHTPVLAPGFHDAQLPPLRSLLLNLLPDDANPIAWLYTPMAVPLLPLFHPELVVYDCMDELASFQNPPKQLLQRESALLNMADLVFAGGPSLYQAKKNRHPNVHCFPSSVDSVHFEQALDRHNSHPAHVDIPTPRLGFYGVIDERFDAELIRTMADAHSDWQIVLVGPIAKIDPSVLPQRINIHYLGQQPYQALPHFLADWDVCLLPFALNDATRFISPTKVLEYMAAGLPIVSTAITDVEQPYGKVVAIAHNATEFVAACERALGATQQQKATLQQSMRTIIANTSWEATVERMRALLDAMSRSPNAIRTSRGTSHHRKDVAPPTGAGPDGPASKVNPLHSHSSIPHAQCVIVGAGPTGLSAAYHLGAEVLLLERNSRVGGWCRSIEDHGFTFDHAGHIMFSNDPYVLKLYDILLGSNQHWQDREAWIYSKNVFTRYPFQGALYGLPPQVIKDCIVGAIEARFGRVDATSTEPRISVNAAHSADAANAATVVYASKRVEMVRSSISANEAHGVANLVPDCCADGSVALDGCNDNQPKDARNFEEFIYQVWGSGIARHFAIPYNRKLWTVPLKDMETSWLGGRVPLPNLESIIEGALEPVAKPMGPNARFGYPLRGGFQALMDGFLPHIRGRVELNANVVQLLLREHVIALADGRRFRYDRLISTMPLPELVKLVDTQAPDKVRVAARGLRHISVRCVNLGIRREQVTDKHWIYYPEQTVFHRIFVQGNASPHCNAPGGFGFTCEISYSPLKPLPADENALIELCIADCIKVGIMAPNDVVLAANQVDMPYAYVVYDYARATNVATIKDWLASCDIELAGRYSEWEYYNSDHAFLAGKKAAERVSQSALPSAVTAPPSV